MTTSTIAAVIADDIIRQLEDGHAPCRRCPTLAAGGYYFESCRVYFADTLPMPDHGIPAGVARIAIDTRPYRGRYPAHEVRVFLESPGDGSTEAADAIAAAVLDLLDPTADYTR
jgi:hypothetical protein